MEIKGLFDSLAGYLDFAIDFLLLSGLEKYARIGTVSPTLVAFFVIGVFVAYLIASTKKVPDYLKASSVPNAAEGATSSSEVDVKGFQTDMARFVLMSILGAVLFHCFLRGYSRVFGMPDINSVKDTLNGVFAYNAVYHPYNAFTGLWR